MSEQLEEPKVRAKAKRSINGYLIADALALVTIISLILAYTKKISLTYFGGSVILTGIAVFLQAKFGGTYLKNNSDATVYTKKEEGSCVSEVGAGGADAELDGVKLSNGQVYKIVDGTHAIVTKNNKIVVTSIFGSFFNEIQGGTLTAPPDDSWKPLFEK